MTFADIHIHYQEVPFNKLQTYSHLQELVLVNKLLRYVDASVLDKFRPVAPGWVMIADIGMVLIMVVPCLVVVGETPLMLRIVGLFPVPPAWEVVMIVVGLPSAEVTNFRIVPAGRGPFV